MNLDYSHSDAQLRQVQQWEAFQNMAGRIAHDFNNLLFIISASAEFLAAETPDDDARHADIMHIREATDKAAELARQLLGFSQRQVLRPTTFAVNDAVARVRPLLEVIVNNAGMVQCIVELDPEVGEIHADAGQIEQVLLNLVMNARDAMPSGGVLRVSTRRVLDEREGSEGEHAAQIVVEDTGVGMTEAVLARVFEPFFTTKDRDLGTGLGLTTAYEIVQKSGGEITLQSTLGVGTRVELRFPEAEMALAGSSR